MIWPLMTFFDLSTSRIVNNIIAMNIGLLHINWKLKTAVLQWKHVQTSERSNDWPQADLHWPKCTTWPIQCARPRSNLCVCFQKIKVATYLYMNLPCHKLSFDMQHAYLLSNYNAYSSQGLEVVRSLVCHIWCPEVLRFLLLYTMNMFWNIKFWDHQRSIKVSLRSILLPQTNLAIFSS